MKDIELKLIAELMKNSRRSDRDLAKALGVSQPTVSRTIRKLEKDGIIKEYTMIPDFAKLGYELMGITLMNVDEDSPEHLAQAREKGARMFEKETVHANLMAVSGSEAYKNRAFITFYKTYADYAKAMDLVKQIPFSEATNVDSFLVDLNGQSHYRLLTLSEIARHILKEINTTSKDAKRARKNQQS
ncbi:MAG TPA: winged helix-turn-helix transcriptional regulator [Candidatus Bathyarchaeia archaeon]|jgi:DNA-binding Lrp family transcriptional regulator|nr:winged helix-turn-helix transcriptional regulator [Candidatus Bathyarchaeia archaeon]